MGGSSSAVLSGLSTPITHTRWDHTYVASDCGWVWRCWGAHAGGYALVRATGSSLVANCLSKPSGTAEIFYGISGVCHQTANRILLPARVRVSAARGYNVSFKTFGDYGRKWQPGWAAWRRRLAACIGAAPMSSMLVDHVGVDRQKVFGKDVAMTDDTRGPTDGKASYGPTLDQLLGYMGDDGGTIEQIRQMCNPHLEQPLPREEEEALVANQNWFESQQRAYVASLESGEINRQSYLEAMNALLAKSMSHYFEVLGEMRFLRIFGEAGFEPDKLIDKTTFLGEH